MLIKFFDSVGIPTIIPTVLDSGGEDRPDLKNLGLGIFQPLTYLVPTPCYTFHKYDSTNSVPMPLQR